MAKKYVPSGYQIINIHIDDYGTFDYGDNESVDKLIDLFKNFPTILSKPILLNVLVSDTFQFIGFPSIANDLTDPSNIQLNLVSIISETVVQNLEIIIDLTTTPFECQFLLAEYGE